MNDFNGIPDFINAIETAAAEMLQLAALALQQEATNDYRMGKNPKWVGKRKKKGEKAYQNPAPKGTFPHVRTGFLASSILYEPKSITAIRQTKYVRIGYRASAFYGIALGNRGWKWLKDSLGLAMPQITAQLQGFTIAANVV